MVILEWAAFLAIVGAIALIVFSQVWNDAKEIAAEEQRKKDWREVNYWKQKSQHPMLHIKDTDGKESTEFILRR